jgi:hypothetical protein
MATLAEKPAAASTGAMQYGATNDAGTDETILASTHAGYTLLVSNTGTGSALAAVAADPAQCGLIAENDAGVAMLGIGRVGAQLSGTRAPLLLNRMNFVGPPTLQNSTLAHDAGEVILDVGYRMYICVMDGMPGQWVRPGLNAITPYRLCDTRAGTGTLYSSGTKLGPQGVLTINGASGPVPPYAAGLMLNLTVTGPTASSFLTVYPHGEARPTASAINFTAGQTIANGVTAKLGADGTLDIFNSAGAVHVIVDVTAFF